MPPSKTQKDAVERVMHAFKHGDLKGRDGRRVRNPKQAIAIGLSEAGASDQVTPEQNRHNLRHTQQAERAERTARQEAQGGQARRRTRAELYAEARRRGVAGRSKMDRAQLERALGE